MKKAALILSLLVVLLAATGAMAEVRLYLYSRVAPVTDKLTVDDIARIEGSARECADIGGLTIERDILADDYIDRDELSKLVSGHVEGPFFIFGSAVRVDSPEETADESGEKIAGGAVIRSGDRVKVRVRKKNITIEMEGRAMNDGRAGDTITVQCRGREYRGVVSDDRSVKGDI